ncbi:MAG: diguanylate cyclase [Gammaproteobacteria bacterium]|nr:diguanylate cyclase [Gammaproteobacteria bacterium]
MSLFSGLEARHAQLLEQGRSDCRQAVSHLVVAAEHGLAHDINLLAEETARLSTDPRSADVAIFNSQGEILAASNSAWLGQKVSRLPSYAVAQFNQALQGRMLVQSGNADAHVITAMMSYALPQRQAELRGLERGVAYVAFDLSDAVKEARGHELAERLPELVVFLLSAALLAFLLHRLVTHPLQSLERAARAVAAGDFAGRLEIGAVGEIQGLSRAFNQMSEQLAERIAQAERLALRDELLESLGEGVCGLDAEGRCTFINPAALAMLGWTRAQAVGGERQQVFRCHQAGCPACANDNCPIVLTLRDGQQRDCDEQFINSAGARFPVHLTVTPIRQGDKTTGAVVAFRDISERKRSERALAESEAKYRRLHESMTEAFVMVNMGGHILESNRAYQAMLGYTAEELKQFTYLDLTPEKWHFEGARLVVDRIVPLGYSDVYEKEYRHKDGHVFPVELRTFLLRDEHGVANAMWSIVCDITKRKQVEAEMLHLATTDPLTGVANRRRFLDQMEMELARFQRYGEPTSLLIIDIDYFKRVNDSYGHAVGDSVLCHLTSLANALLRRNDLFGRLGGEEFGILLPATRADGAAEFAERFRQYVSDNPARSGQTCVAFTISIGVTEVNMGDEHPDHVLARADTALYRAKESGRNRVEVAA